MGGAKAAGAQCLPVLKSLQSRCVMRGFAQYHCAVYRPHAMIAPCLRETGKIMAPVESAIVIRSIGSPETDRGPPNS
jgi:hypothetical protein